MSRGHHPAGHRVDRCEKRHCEFEKVEVPVLGIVENMSVHISVTVVTMNRFSVPVVLRNWLKIPHTAAGADAVTHLLT